MKVQKWLEPDNLLLLEAWARDGLAHDQIAKNCGVASQTLWKWTKKYDIIKKALSKGREVFDIEVENAAAKKAKGFYYTEEIATKCKRVFYDESGHRCEEEFVVTTPIERYCPPDTMAAMYWLNNRKKQEWSRNPIQDASEEAIAGAKKILEGVKSAF